MNPAFVDTGTRTRAATDFTTNLVVEAGAGTGKTSLLVERLLNLCLSGTASIRRIVAITFTEKAAAEMRERVATALEDLAEGRTPKPHGEAARAQAWLTETAGVDPQTLRERAAETLELLDHAGISTIHAFCADLIRRHPVEAGVPPDFEVGNAAEIRAVFDRVWADHVAATHGRADAKATEAWRQVLAFTDMDELEDKIALQVARQPAVCEALATEGYVPVDLKRNLAGHLRRVRQEIADALTGMELAAFTSQATTTMKLLELGETRGLDALQAFWRDAKTQTLLEKNLGSPGRNVPEELHKGLKARVNKGKILAKTLAESEEPLFHHLGAVLQPFCREFRRHTLERGLLSFDDLLLLARNLLRDHDAVRRQESARMDAVLLDEFQDTDPLQYEIMFLVAQADAPPASVEGQTDLFGADADDAVQPLTPGRLFIVGDPKQSIYRFRGADMTAYTQAVTRILEGAEPLQLQTNFRSRPELIAAVNALFTGWMGEEGDPEVEPGYVAIEPRPEEARSEMPRVEILSVEAPAGANREAVRLCESRAVAREILRLNAEGVPFGEMAVLLRAMTQVQIYLRALRDANIPYVVDGGKAFAQRHEVMECLGMLRALANPGDAVGALAALRSSYGGVTDPELAAYARDGGDFVWLTPREVEARHPAVARVFTELRALERATRNLPVDRRVVDLLTQGPFFMAQAAYADGPQRTANVRKLARRAADLAREHGAPMDQVIQALEEEFLPEMAEGESPLADEALDAVRVLTAHRAKGLEYRHVLLPDIPGQDHYNDNEIRVRGLSTPRGFRVGLKAGKRKNCAWAFAEEADKRHQTAESRRLLYVALTRAKERITVFFGPSARGNAVWHEGLKRWGYDTRLGSGQPDTLAPGLVCHRTDSGEPLQVPAREEAATRALESARAFQHAGSQARVERGPALRTPSAGKARAEAADLTETDVATGLRPGLARAVGNAAHAVLERWDFQDLDALEGLLQEAAQSESHGDLAPETEVLAEARAILEAFAGSPLAARLAQADILGRETPILFQDPQGVTVYGYADLIYRHDGRVHVADYKTDQTDAAQAASAYRSQLDDYACAVQRALGLPEPPVREILLLRSSERVVLD